MFQADAPIFSKSSDIQNVIEPRGTNALSYSDQFLTRYNAFGRDCVCFRLGINQTYTLTPLLSNIHAPTPFWNAKIIPDTSIWLHATRTWLNFVSRSNSLNTLCYNADTMLNIYIFANNNDNNNNDDPCIVGRSFAGWQITQVTIKSPDANAKGDLFYLHLMRPDRFLETCQV